MVFFQYIPYIQKKKTQGYNPSFGIGYIQALFTNSTIYPFIGLTSAYDINYKSYLISAIVGINVRLITKSEKTGIKSQSNNKQD